MKILRSIEPATVMVELVIVFVGLFAALQVDEWRQEQELAEAQDLMLERLQGDIDTAIVGLVGEDGNGGLLAFTTRNWRATDHVARSLAAGRLLDGDTASFRAGLVFYGHLPALDVTDAAFQEMLASGLFSRVEDEALKSSVSALYQEARKTTEDFNWWRSSVQQVDPLLWPRVRYRRAGEEGDNITGHTADFEFRDLVGDPELANAFYWAADTQADWVGRVRDLHAAAVDARDRLMAYRGSP